MTCHSSSWKVAYEVLPPEQRHWVEMFAFESVALLVEGLGGSVAASSGVALALDPASQMLKNYQVYVRKARRYQNRQDFVKDWSDLDLAKALAWKATREVLDHLRKIRARLTNPRKTPIGHRESDEDHKYLIAYLVSYLHSLDKKVGGDAAAFLEFVSQRAEALTETPKRGISFKVKFIAAEMTELRQECWNENRVQRARAFAIKELSYFQRSSIEEIVHFTRLRKA